MNRRAFFRSLFFGGLGLVDEALGRPHHILDEIPLLPDSEIDAMVPIFRSGISLEVRDGWISAARGQDSSLAPLTPVTELGAIVLGLFDGRRTVADIGAEAGILGACSPEEAAGEARGLFLALISKGVCHPLDEPR